MKKPPTMRPMRAPLSLAVALALGCEPASTPEPTRAISSASSTTPETPAPSAAATQDRSSVSLPAKGLPVIAPKVEEATIEAPRSLKDGERAPFVLLLHGLGGTGPSIAKHFALREKSERRHFLWAAPSGPLDKERRRFWNAGAACCDFEGTGPDHVAALGALIARAKADPRVDPARVYVIGYSNGGFMAHRLGCEVEGLAGIASIAGAAMPEVASCAHAPRFVLEVHGDADRVVSYEGGHVLGKAELPTHLGALETLRGWAKAKGCSGDPKDGPRFDLDPDLDGDETTRVAIGCAPSVVLFRVAGAGHAVASNEAVIDRILDALFK